MSKFKCQILKIFKIKENNCGGDVGKNLILGILKFIKQPVKK